MCRSTKRALASHARRSRRLDRAPMLALTLLIAKFSKSLKSPDLRIRKSELLLESSNICRFVSGIFGFRGNPCTTSIHRIYRDLEDVLQNSVNFGSYASKVLPKYSSKHSFKKSSFGASLDIN